MARRGNSVIGMDLGKRSYKAVLLHKKSDARYVLTNFATHQVTEEPASAESITLNLKQLLKELGGHSKTCAVGVSDPGALLRIIEQPSTPPELLRNALRYNGLAMLNQECKDFVLDVARLSAEAPPPDSVAGNGGGGVALQAAVGTQTRYLVGGMLRSQVKQIAEALGKTRLSAQILQLAPVCALNAFEFAHPQVHRNEAFLLLDLGHSQSTVLIGRNGELTLTRSFEYGGKHFTQALTADGARDAEAAHLLIKQGDAGMAEICRNSLARVATE